MGFDVQGGGSDLVFPHHEYSAVHAEALTATKPFARAYVHAAMIGLDGEKMSKSRGNLVFVSRLRGDGVDPMAIRLALLSGHYRTDRAWTADLLSSAQERLATWRRAVALDAGAPAAPLLAGLRERLSDDLDSPGAIALVDEWAARTLAGVPDAEEEAPRIVCDAVDALLGVALDSSARDKALDSCARDKALDSCARDKALGDHG
jgi:L-cysteine:1D-myo-inositol 2-amino-2-deoxy-alpha-D-glucopyranoside ligase